MDPDLTALTSTAATTMVQLLATAAWERATGVVWLWGMNVDQAIQRICATTANTLTPATWKQYVSPDLPYRPPCP